MTEAHEPPSPLESPEARRPSTLNLVAFAVTSILLGGSAALVLGSLEDWRFWLTLPWCTALAAAMLFGLDRIGLRTGYGVRFGRYPAYARLAADERTPALYLRPFASDPIPINLSPKSVRRRDKTGFWVLMAVLAPMGVVGLLGLLVGFSEEGLLGGIFGLILMLTVGERVGQAAAWLVTRAWPRAKTMEEAIARSVQRSLGPFIGLGGRGDDTGPAWGYARVKVDDEHWKQAVAYYATLSRCILLSPGDSEGLGWEVGHLVREGYLSKVFLVVPLGYAYEAERWTAWMNLAESHGLDMPQRIATGSLLAFDAHGTATVLLESASRGEDIVEHIREYLDAQGR